jgi:hypothetical protein
MQLLTFGFSLSDSHLARIELSPENRLLAGSPNLISYLP